MHNWVMLKPGLASHRMRALFLGRRCNLLQTRGAVYVLLKYVTFTRLGTSACSL